MHADADPFASVMGIVRGSREAQLEREVSELRAKPAKLTQEQEETRLGSWFAAFTDYAGKPSAVVLELALTLARARGINAIVTHDGSAVLIRASTPELHDDDGAVGLLRIRPDPDAGSQTGGAYLGLYVLQDVA